MVKHIILWKLRDELSAAEKQTRASAIKQGLEGLKGQVVNGKWVNGKCKKVVWNGKALPNFQISVKELKKGGELKFIY